MSLLNDSELEQLLSGPNPMVSGFPSAVASATKLDPFGEGSAIQPSSIDLHIGDIVLPGEKGGGSKSKPATEIRTSHSLEPGHSIIITSHETFAMPENVGALAFPVAGRRQQPILMLNPGHIDPGYRGKLWFSFINVGRSPFPMRKGDRIATVVFWRLTAAARAPWEARYGHRDRSEAPEEAVLSISGDCLQVEARSRSIAKETVARERWLVTAIAIILPVVVTLASTWVANHSSGMQKVENRVTKSEARLDVLEGKVDYGQAFVRLEGALQKQDARVDSVEAKLRRAKLDSVRK
jgi:deoxycytidine triphosphate deaminase